MIHPDVLADHATPPTPGLPNLTGIDLPTAYAKSGLQESPENDVLLTAVINATLTAIERHLDRILPYGEGQESVYYTHQARYHLERYPVSAIEELTADGVAITMPYKLHHASGMIMLDRVIINRELRVVYAGGYHTLPADLQLAFWMAFDYFFGLSQGGGGGLGAGDVESVTITGVGTVRFATGNSGVANAGTVDPGGATGLPSFVLGFLAPYRRFSA